MTHEDPPPGALAWLIGDVNGDSKAEVVQLWDNAGRLGMIVWGLGPEGCFGAGCNYIGAYFDSTNMGQGSGALAWLIGDVNGDGKAEVVQPWDNAGRLGMIVYGSDGSGGYHTIIPSPPVAVATASPSNVTAGTTVTLDGTGSYATNPFHNTLSNNQ